MLCKPSRPRSSGLFPVYSSGHPSETPSDLKPTDYHVQRTMLGDDGFDKVEEADNVSPAYGVTVRNAPVIADNSHRLVAELKEDVERMTLVAERWECDNSVPD